MLPFTFPSLLKFLVAKTLLITFVVNNCLAQKLASLGTFVILYFLVKTQSLNGLRSAFGYASLQPGPSITSHQYQANSYSLVQVRRPAS